MHEVLVLHVSCTKEVADWSLGLKFGRPIWVNGSSSPYSYVATTYTQVLFVQKLRIQPDIHCYIANLSNLMYDHQLTLICLLYIVILPSQDKLQLSLFTYIDNNYKHT